MIKKYLRPLPVLVVLAALVISIGLVLGPQGLGDLSDKRAVADRLERENDELERQNKAKRDRVEKLLGDRSTIEIEIRKRLGMKKPDETLFQSSTPDPAGADGSGTSSPRETVAP